MEYTGKCIECSKDSLTNKNYCSDCNKQILKLMEDFYKRRKVFYPEMTKITEKIYLGNEDGQREKELLQNEGITHILICGSQLHVFHPDIFNYKILDIDDSLNQKIDDLFQDTFDFIEKADKVYLHCAAGISRSASILIAYFMKKENLSYQKAYEKVKEKRGCIDPNRYFVKQLLKYEEDLKLSNI